MDPYRASPAPAPIEKVRRLPEDDLSGTRKMRARTWSNGTTWIRVRPNVGIGSLILNWFMFFLFALAALAAFADPKDLGEGRNIMTAIASLFAGLLIRNYLGGERYLVGKIGLSRKRLFRRTEVYLHDEISTVVVLGDERIDLQIGRRRIQLCQKLGHKGDQLRWLARRLRRAIDFARGN